MTIRYATKTGVWSDVSVWDGGTTLPDSTDDVYANNFTVSIDQDITVNRLRAVSNASPAITAGGWFTITDAATITITAGVASADIGFTTFLLVNAGSATVTVNASITGGSSASRVGLSVASGYSGSLTVNGNITGGTNGSARGMNSASGSGGPSITINGNITAATAEGFVNALSSATITINGDVRGATLEGFKNAADTCIIAINGAVTGGSANAGFGCHITGSNVQTTVVGAIRGGTGSGSWASQGPWGFVQAGGFLRVDALLRWGTGGSAPIQCFGTAVQFVQSGTELGLQAPSDDNWPAATGADIVIERYATGNPAPADVREGTTYDSTGMSTGTLAVPSPESVAAGVPVDGTVGTATLDRDELVADLIAAHGAQIAAATSG